MAGPKIIVTLISAGQARVGFSFIHRGAGEKCGECRYFSVCVKNLEDNRVYKIVNVRDRFLRCELYDVDMRVVEVVESEVLAAVSPKQSIEGAIITFHSQKCSVQDCENAALCSPEGLRDGDRCEVVKVCDNLKCPVGLQLRKALLRRAPPSF
ncbi:UPF0179 family protein [Candidatus Bathyarchaeota archaeon]|nr:UPF0179 family protein [Candidatus Bathyarchaeota archaeon]